MVMGGLRPVLVPALLLFCCFELVACSASKETKVEEVVPVPAKFATFTLGQLKLHLPVSMLQPTGVFSVGSNNLAIHSQSASHPKLRVETLDNFQDRMARYLARGILDDSIKTFDGFFSELVNLVGTRNYLKLQKNMGVNVAISAKKYKRDNPAVYQFDFLEAKHIYIVFSNPKNIAEIYSLKGEISDADVEAIISGIRN